MNELPIYRLGNHQSLPTRPTDRDPRGILWLWELPNDGARYIIGCDPTVGIPGWTRHTRSGSDHKTDNAAIEVIRVGSHGRPDVQVAEYAAPVAPIELAPILNHIGRLFKGDNEEGEAHVIIEIYPGPGLMLQQELMTKYQYTNLYQHRYLNVMGAPTKNNLTYGWTANRQTVDILWTVGLHAVNNDKVAVKSPWLIDEMANCVRGQRGDGTITLQAAFGNHDDRIRAFLLALWAARDWSGVFSDEIGSVEQVNAPNAQATDMSAADMYNDWNARFSDLLDE